MDHILLLTAMVMTGLQGNAASRSTVLPQVSSLWMLLALLNIFRVYGNGVKKFKFN